MNQFENKTVIITGHTGFKGSWLAIWMHLLGAKVIGISNKIPTNPSHFKYLQMKNKIKNIKLDIRDLKKLKSTFKSYKPDYVFHLAAQALVSKSYIDPKNTFEINIMGSVNVLEAVKKSNSVKSLVYVTSDKCYENKEWIWGYRENDELGGYDPYSASKASAEIIFSSDVNIFYSDCKYFLFRCEYFLLRWYIFSVQI